MNKKKVSFLNQICKEQEMRKDISYKTDASHLHDVMIRVQRAHVKRSYATVGCITPNLESLLDIEILISNKTT